jgi:hypothetical protein
MKLVEVHVEKFRNFDDSDVVYGERLSGSGAGHVTSAVVGLVVAIVGVVMLGSAEEPATGSTAGTGGASPVLTT